jgi:AbrB family looped-hinge helix DNA binding protein
MQSETSKVTTKGQIVIPKRIRERYGIGPSTTIRWIEKNEGIMMVPDNEDAVVAARGMLAGSGILQAYMDDKEKEKQREKKKFARKK